MKVSGLLAPAAHGEVESSGQVDSSYMFINGRDDSFAVLIASCLLTILFTSLTWKREVSVATILVNS